MSSWHRRFQKCLSPLWKRTRRFYMPADKKLRFPAEFFNFAKFYAALEAFLAAKAFIVSMM